jgi:oligopeptide/dipeptide ABC transporter ATP-binding protein
MHDSLLTVRDLRVSFTTPGGVVRAVDGVDLDLGQGEILALVGESGSGKSVTAQTIVGLTRGEHARLEGEVRYGEQELLRASEAELRRVRGAEIAMVFQDPMTSLNPLQRVGPQIVEMIRLHRDVSQKEAERQAIERLAEVGIAQPERRARGYPHEFSGGMRQRAMIAMALACSPKILIADEPTTALDVTIQAQVLAVIEKLRRDHGTAVLLITHDLGVVAQVADRVAVMYAGSIVETAGCEQLFADPQHPYTWGLLGSVPRVDRDQAELKPIAGTPPSLLAPPEGCRFRPRCPVAFERCPERPSLESRTRDGRLDACWREPRDKRALRDALLEGAVG